MDIKFLRQEKRRLEANLEANRKHQIELKSYIAQTLNDLESIQKKIKNIESDGHVEVSEHAMVRLFERKYHYPVEQLKQDLVSKVQSTVKFNRNCNVHFEEGLVAIIKDGVVVTIRSKNKEGE